MTHYSGIQSLRGVAVLAVVLYHLFPKIFALGYTGVDIFFVISGFVISFSLTKVDSPISLTIILDFYQRRILRLFPPLFICCVFYLSLFYILFPVQKVLESALHALNSLLGISNFTFYQMGDYFSNDSSIIVFLHTWSLSLEWQFYVLLPIILLLKKFKYIAYFFLFFVSFILFIIIFDQYGRFSYFMLPTRLWEFLLGVLLCVYGNRLRVISNFPSFGLLLLLISWLLFGNFIWQLEKSNEILISIVLTALVLLNLVQQDSLKLPVLNVIGNASYSLYLYHWPLIAVMNYFYLDNYIDRILLCVGALILGMISFFFVEKKRINYFTSFTFFLGLFAILLVFLGPRSELRKNLDEQVDNKLFKNGACSVAWNNPVIVPHLCTLSDFNDYKSSKVLIVGDSFAEAFANGIELNYNSVSGVGMFARGCFPIVGAERVGKPDEFHCNEFYKKVLQTVRDLKSLSTIFVVARFDHYLNSTHFLDNPSYTEYGIAPVKYEKLDGAVASSDYLKEGFKYFLSQLQLYNESAKIYVVYGFPYGTIDVIRLGYKKNLMRDFKDEIGIDLQQHERRNEYVTKMIETLPSIGVEALDASKAICLKNACSIIKNEHPLYFDDDHPSIHFIKLFVDYFKLRKVISNTDG